MAKHEIGVELDLLLNKIRNAIIVSALEKSKLSLDDTVNRLSFVDLLKESNVALALEEFNIYCRDNGGTTQAYVNGQSGFIDIFGSDNASLGSGGFTFVGGGVVDIQSDNNITIVANGTDVLIQSSTDAVVIDGALGITFLNGGGTSPIRSGAQFVVGTSLTALNAWISARNGSVSRAAIYVEPQVNYTGANQPGLLWNSSVNRSFIEQQLIGNKSLVGFISGSTGNSNTVTNTVVSTLITTNGYTFTIPANSLSIGKRLRVNLRGYYSSGNPSPSLTTNLQIGGTIIKTTGARTLIANQTNQGIRCTFDLRIVSIGAVGTVNASIEQVFAYSTPTLNGSSVANIANSTINTTIANILQVSVQWSVASASNSITFEDITYEVLN